MRPGAHVLQQDIKAGEGIVVLTDQLIVPINMSGVAHRAHAQQIMAGRFDLHGAFIIRRAAIARQSRNALPYARHHGAVYLVGAIMGTQCPQAVKTGDRTLCMLSKCTSHRVIPPVMLYNQPLSAPTMTPFAKNFCRKGYRIRIGREDTTISAYLTDSAYLASSPRSVTDAFISEV